MWQLRRMLAANRSEIYASELFESSSRSFIAIIAVLYLGWHLFAAATWPSSIGSQMWLPTACFIPLAAVAYLLVTRQFFVAQFVWLSCLLATVTVVRSRVTRSSLRRRRPMAVVSRNTSSISGWAAAGAVSTRSR